jgi:VanZ family protein
VRIFTVYYLPVLLWALAIFMVSAQPSLPSPTVATLDFLIKKAGHMFVYGVLYFLILRAWLKSQADWPTSRTTANQTLTSSAVWGPLLLCLLYAISDEAHQSFVFGRFGSPRDVGFDMLGAGIVFLKTHGYF